MVIGHEVSDAVIVSKVPAITDATDCMVVQQESAEEIVINASVNTGNTDSNVLGPDATAESTVPEESNTEKLLEMKPVATDGINTEKLQAVAVNNAEESNNEDFSILQAFV
ncbi:hypothetical protein V6N12_050795 [Hibiscus sabdariffa]|uniref:Uncharacterized protein n=1 Tax=Hibiscus sabdariffa TaxID=183260 RepID=A0ABR2GDV0_9ROSI